MSDTLPVVLIIDDNEENLDVFERRITRYGYAVDRARNGREGLAKIRAGQYDLVLLDIMMPEMNGYQVLERIKQDPEHRNLPVIVISAVDDIESIVRCIKLGAEDYLPKPFNPLILKARISASLEKKRLRDQEEAHLEEQAISQRVARELNARLSLRRAAELTLDWAMKRTSAHAGFFARLVDSESDMFFIEAVSGEDNLVHYYLDKEMHFDSESAKRAIEMIMPQFSVDEPDYWIADTQSRLYFPIGRGGQLIGMLVLEDRAAERYPTKVLSFLTVLSDRASTAMSNAVLYEAVQSANLAKTEFISEVSHELKNPMTSIRNYAKMLSSAGEINDTQARFIQTIVSNIDRMNRLVADLSDISRIESNHLRLELEALSISEIIDSVVSIFETQIEQKGQTLTIAIQKRIPQIYGDRNRLEQILTNLISNAHKYTLESGKIRVGARLERVGTGGRPKLIEISVADTGIGLREEDKAKIFSKYFRAADSRTTGTPGTGLGLRITKQLVELQGGEIWFDSVKGKGSIFYFTIPIYTEELRRAIEAEQDSQKDEEGFMVSH